MPVYFVMLSLVWMVVCICCVQMLFSSIHSCRQPRMRVSHSNCNIVRSRQLVFIIITSNLGRAAYPPVMAEWTHLCVC